MKGAVGPRDVSDLVEALGFSCELISGGEHFLYMILTIRCSWVVHELVQIVTFSTKLSFVLYGFPVLSSSSHLLPHLTSSSCSSWNTCGAINLETSVYLLHLSYLISHQSPEANYVLECKSITNIVLTE